MSRRPKIQIVSEILNICKDGEIKTHIVYGTNLNFRTVGRILDRLIAIGWLTKDENVYKTTSSARELMSSEAYKNVTSLSD